MLLGHAENKIRTTSETLSKRLSVPSTSRVYRRLFRRHLKRSHRRIVRYSLLTVNLALLIGVVLFVSQNPNNDVNSKNAILGPSDATLTNPLDQLSSADIAVHVSRMTGLAEAVAITNQADSESTLLSITPADNIVVAKPQLVATSSKSAKDIKIYTAVEGDNLQNLANKFGVTSDSIRWSNGLTSNNIPAGKQLLIPPVNGIVYIVKAGDTIDSIVQRYSGNKDALIADNDAEVSGLRVGQRILIRDGMQPVARTATFSYARGFSFGLSAIYGYNGYDYGYCTWYVANVRASIGRPVPANLGNASTWDDRAALAGLPVNKSPAYGAAVVTSQRGAGHVAFVEKVNEDGSVWISEMNSRGQVSMTDSTSAGGWGRRDFKLIPADQARTYNYIH